MVVVVYDSGMKDDAMWHAMWRHSDLKTDFNSISYTLSGRTGSGWPVIPKVARSRLTESSKSCDLQPVLHCAIRLAQGVLPCVRWGCDQSIGSTVSDAIIHSWFWSTATRSCPLGYFNNLLQVVDN